MSFNVSPIAIKRAFLEVFRHNERTTLRSRGNFLDFSGKWIGRGQKNALEHGEHVCLILWKAFIKNLSEHRALQSDWLSQSSGLCFHWAAGKGAGSKLWFWAEKWVWILSTGVH